MGSVVIAALALPGVWHTPARAEGAPEQGLVGFKVLNYQDSQPGFKRVAVNSPSFLLIAPLGPDWAVEGSTVFDHVSGASPRWHTAVSGASHFEEERIAADVKLTRYLRRSSYSLGLAHSGEHDYKSNAVSLAGSWSSEDNNTSWNLGLGHARDRIDATDGGYNGDVSGKRKKTTDVLLGVTQALGPVDLVQVNLGYSRGEGYYNDPYKQLDVRPDRRTQDTLLLRWNHHFADGSSTLRSSYRYYKDSFQVKAHTLQFEWVQPLSPSLSLTPLLRLYTQSAASFYVDPVYDPALLAPYPQGYDVNNPPATISEDQRLSAFGAVTLGLKGAYQLDELWTFDAKAEFYRQRGDWRVGGDGSPGLAVFNARFLQFGLSRKF